MKKLNVLVCGLIAMFTFGSVVNAEEVNVNSEAILNSCLKTNNNTCVLSENILLNAQIVIPVGVDVILDLNGKSISPSSTLRLNEGMIVVSNGAKLVVNDSVGTGAIETKDTTVYGALQVTNSATYDPSLKSTIIINGGIIEGYYSGIVGNGNRGNTEIIINDGTVRCTNLASSCTAIYHPQPTVVVGEENIISTLTVNGGTVTGGTGIGLRGGKLVVNGGTIIGQYEETVVIPSTNGTTTFGVGIGISQHTTQSEVEVEITGGIIKGSTALYESNPQNNPEEAIEKVKISITGGTFEKINLGTEAVYSENKDKFITGGTFTTPVTKYLAEEVNVTTDSKGNVVINKKYNINVESAANGTVNVNKNETIAGDNVSIDIKANEGYQIDKIIVKDVNGKEIVVENNEFKMPENDVEVVVTFLKIEKNETSDVVKNPETSDINIISVLSVFTLGFFGLAYTINNRKFN